MIVALPNDSITVLNDLLQQFAVGELSYEELWADVDAAFQPADSSISEASATSGI